VTTTVARTGAVLPNACSVLELSLRERLAPSPAFRLAYPPEM